MHYMDSEIEGRTEERKKERKERMSDSLLIIQLKLVQYDGSLEIGTGCQSYLYIHIGCITESEMIKNSERFNVSTCKLSLSTHCYVKRPKLYRRPHAAVLIKI